MQGIAIASVLSRILWNFYWMHQDNTIFTSITDKNDGRILDVPPSPSAPLLLLRNNEFSSNYSGGFDLWTMEDPFAGEQAAHQRRLERQQRTRPPPAANQTAGSSSNTEAAVKLRKDKVITIGTSMDNDHDWKSLCQGAGLSSSSRVVITRALTASAGPALALLLSKQCGVEHIVGVDSLLPNLRKVRMKAMNVYQMLYRSINDFQLVVPTATAGIARLDDSVELEWLIQFHPSHIIHMEEDTTTTNDKLLEEHQDGTATASNLWDEYMSRKSQRLYYLHHSVHSLHQLLRYGQSRSDKRGPLVFLHVVTTTAAKTTKTTHNLATTRIHCLLSECYSSLTGGRVRMQQMELPASIYGPTVGTTTSSSATPVDNSTFFTMHNKLFVDDAMAGILTALHQRPGLHRMTVNTATSDATATSKKESLRGVQTLAYRLSLEHPYGAAAKEKNTVTHHNDTYAAVTAQYRQTYGLHTTRFPCASSCNGPTSPPCQPSAFDVIIPITLTVTEKCKYVVYLLDFSAHLKELFKPMQSGGTPLLCRIAFVSGKSPVVQVAVARHVATENRNSEGVPAASTKEEALQRYNGKLKSNGWTLVWLAHDDETTLTDAEYALVRMEPGKFFAPEVAKAMLSGTSTFVEHPDLGLQRILSRIDRAALPRHMRKEERSGIKVSRFVEHPAENARAVALFVSEHSSKTFQAKTIAEYAKHIATDSSLAIPRRQITFYRHASHFVQTDWNRPEDESRQTVYFPFPFQWVSKDLVVHDMHLEAARMLRCSWYDEHLYWGHSNRGAEELSLAYVLGKRRIEASIGPGLDGDPSWVPVWDGNQQRVLTHKNTEVFLRIMKREQN